MRLRLFPLVVMFVLAVGATTTVAADNAGTPKLTNMSAAEFLDYHAELAKQLKTKKYEHINNSSLDDIALEQSKIRSLIGTHKSLDELSDVDQVSVFNAHERVIAIVENAENDRVICKRQKVVGSHRPVNVCNTVGELKRAREELAKDEIMRKSRCSGGNCSGG